MTFSKIEISNFYKLKKLEIEVKKLDNLSNAYSKKIGELKDYLTLMVTITFGKPSNVLIMKNPLEKNEKVYYSLLKKQYRSLMYFIKKLRKTKLIKNPVYYFTVFELQENGNLHMHMHLAINQNDLDGFVNFIYWYKNQKFENVYNIGRTYIALSSSYKKNLEDKLYEVKDKKDLTKKPYIMKYLETRDFDSGEATFWEFLSINDLIEKYNENIINYIKKTIVSQIDKEVFKIGAIKNWNLHNLKTILNSIENPQFRKDVKVIRKVGQIYTYSHSLFALKFRLYQDNYSKLVQVNNQFKSYYRANKDFERGILQFINQKIFYNNVMI